MIQSAITFASAFVEQAPVPRIAAERTYLRRDFLGFGLN